MRQRKLDLTAAGYVFHDNKVLLVLHSKLNLWLPPGGHIDPNESPDEAAKREILEETGLNVNIIDIGDLDLGMNEPNWVQTPLPFYTNIHSVGDHDHWGACYLCESSTSQVIMTPESKNIGWFSKEEVANHESIRSDIKRIIFQAFDLIDRLKSI